MNEIGYQYSKLSWLYRYFKWFYSMIYSGINYIWQFALKIISYKTTKIWNFHNMFKKTITKKLLINSLSNEQNVLLFESSMLSLYFVYILIKNRHLSKFPFQSTSLRNFLTIVIIELVLLTKCIQYTYYTNYNWY